MKILLRTNSIADYRRFLIAKRIPRVSVTGHVVTVPDEYAHLIDGEDQIDLAKTPYVARRFLFDYQRDIAKVAAQKRKYCIFADCGLGKTLNILEFARHASGLLPKSQCVLIISPLMVISQTLAECKRFYGDSLPIKRVRAAELREWMLKGKDRIGITNYDALTDDISQGRLGALILDESSMLKSHYGAWGTKCIELGRGLSWKLACTGTPAPNDRIEYANHAVFMDAYPTVNSFLARFFVNRGHTDNRWELKPHALEPFYRALSDWCIFLTNPATYGWKDNCENVPPIHVHIHDVELTRQQRDALHETTGALFAVSVGGITSRSQLGQIAKGNHNGIAIETAKPAFIRRLVDSWPDESTLIWCIYNHEQDTMEVAFPEAASIRGETPPERREELIADFKAGRRRILISKPKILGFGLNLQVATRQVFSGLQDSYESYYQAVKRSNRYGATKPLNVHIPITEVERPMIETVLQKAKMIQRDTEEQERIFRHASIRR